MVIRIDTSSTPSGRRYSKRRGHKTKGVIAKLKYDVRNLKLSQELKFFQIEFTDTDNDEGGDFIECFVPAQNNSDSTRNGDKVLVKHIELKGTIHLNANLELQHTRLMVFYDKQDSITVPASEVLFDLPATAPYAPLRFYNVDKRKEWVLIYDRNWVLDIDKPIIRINFSKRLNKIVQFNAGGININTGSFKIFAISSKQDTDVADNRLTYRVNIRFRYLDS